MLLSRQPGLTIVTDSVTSTGLARFITEWGGTHYRFKRGYRAVIDEAIRLNEEGIDCPLAIETSGHAAFRDNHFLDDGMYLVTMLICEAMDLKREARRSIRCWTACRSRWNRGVAPGHPRRRSARGRAGNDRNHPFHTLEDPSWRLAADNREGVRILFDFGAEVESAWFQLRNERP